VPAACVKAAGSAGLGIPVQVYVVPVAGVAVLVMFCDAALVVPAVEADQLVVLLLKSALVVPLKPT